MRAKEVHQRKASERTPYFNFKKFTDDVISYMDRNGVGITQLATETGISNTTLAMFRDGFQCSLKTACILSDWADLSLDAYRVREFG